MANYQPVLDAEIDEMQRLYEARGLSVRQVAKVMQRSPTTVSKALRGRGVDTWRADSSAAVEAIKLRANKRRLALIDGLLDDVDLLRERLTDEYQLVVNSSEGAEMVRLDEPPAEAVQAFARSVNTHLQAVDRIIENVHTDDSAQSKSMLERMLGGIEQLLKDDPGAGLGERDQDSDYDVKDHLDD
ncbi:helix-turn-helix domain-containing protein [Corynebacterium sp. H127]|uniref:helix-turn-helix domain-containing protein n=1 Tax=Corynebacterium sp. H127 TaxID=3133418 RepID=UPI0030B74DC5